MGDGPSIPCVLLTLLLGCHAVPSRHHKGDKPDGEFVNFPAGLSGGGSHKIKSHPINIIRSSAIGGYNGGTDGFDPRLADPPCIWTSWSSCSSECDGGVAYRFRLINNECPYGPDSQVRPCNIHPCPQNCVLAEWAAWNDGCSECSVPCGGGLRSRTRDVLTPALFGGVCNGRTVQTESCNEQPCPVDCIASGLWTNWGACSAAECGGGIRSRSRSSVFVTVVRRGASQTEAQCPTRLEEEPCNTAECAIDCLVDRQWTEWSACSETCGTDGQQTRSREIVVFPQNGGALCPNTLETRLCSEGGGISLPACDFVRTFSLSKKPQPPHRFPSNPIIIPPPPKLRILVPKKTSSVVPQRARRLQSNRQTAFKPSSKSSNSPNTSLNKPLQLPATIDPNFCRGRPDGVYAHPLCQCCSDLILCRQGRYEIKWCSPQLVFAEQFKRCVTRAQAGC